MNEPQCGATDWATCDDGRPHIYGVCGKAPHPQEKWHQEWRDDRLWAEWSGDSGPVPAGPPCEHDKRLHLS